MISEKIKSTLLKALTEAGALVKKSLLRGKTVEKKTELSLVTEIDRKSENLILKIIRKSFPDHAFLTEESPASGNSTSRWIIDPIDGTTNFAHTLPVACISIAYEEKGVLQLGGVLDPFRGELFWAEKGRGAFLNKKRIHVSKTPRLSESLLATGFPYDRREKINEYLPVFKDFLMKVQGIRRMGAAAIDLCYVACGRFDGYWEAKLSPWDMAAGMLIVLEAGGKLSDFSGGKMPVDSRQTLATNGLLHIEMLDVLKPHGRIGLD